MTKQSFDAEAAYDEHVAPLMTKIIEVCREHGIPMVASFLYGRSEGEEHLCSTALPGPEGRGSTTLETAIRIIQRGIGEHERVCVETGTAAITVTRPA